MSCHKRPESESEWSTAGQEAKQQVVEENTWKQAPDSRQATGFSSCAKIAGRRRRKRRMCEQLILPATDHFPVEITMGSV